ncbi:MAG: hypothetical protein H6607_11965 [Flavobacteriales bacterium]|nr:hypothetical protein [Flavobacteriales bacterium]
MKEEEENINTATEGAANAEKQELTLSNVFQVLLVLLLMGLPYIYISHQSDKKLRRVEALKEELKELRAEFITLKSELVGQNKQSDVAKRLKDRQIEPLSKSPIDLNDKKR